MNSNNAMDSKHEFIPKLSYDKMEEIVEDLLQDPVETVEIASSPQDEACENSTTFYFGVARVAAKWCVYSCQEEDTCPEFGGSFCSREEALERASVWAYETEQAAEDGLDDQRDAEWAMDAEVPCSLEAPFRFSDTTDFVRAVELKNEDEVFDFFKRREFLFSPEEWGNLYSPHLADANGKACWVARSHRGEMRLIEE